MSKFSNPKKTLGEHRIVKTFRLYESEVRAVKKIHSNFSEFTRDAILEKLERMDKES